MCDDTNAIIEKDWKVIKSSYKGGTGQNNQIVRPFNINVPQNKESPQQKNKTNPKIMESPSSLLDSFKNNKDMENTDDIKFVEKPLKKNRLIEVISDINHSREESVTLKRESTIKKGFLDKRV